MTNRLSHPRGNATIVILVAVLVVAGLLGFWYFASRNTNTNSQTANLQNTNASANANLGVPEAPTVTSVSGLVAAEGTLDTVDLNTNSSDDTQLDGYLNEF